MPPDFHFDKNLHKNVVKYTFRKLDFDKIILTNWKNNETIKEILQ